MRSAIGEQLEKIGAQNDELKRLAASLDEVPSESQINEMLEKLEETCRRPPRPRRRRRRRRRRRSRRRLCGRT